MKVETSKIGPRLNLKEPDGERPQADAAQVDHVLIDGTWRKIIPGSFHFYVTEGAKPVPFIQYDMVSSPGTGGVDPEHNYRCEVFPTAIMGLAYPVSTK
jgi:hypothetical protein